MRYIKLENNQPIQYSLEQLFIDYPNAIIYRNCQMPDESLLANYNVYPLITESKPKFDEDEIAEESIPEFRDGEWHQTWKVKKLPIETIEELIAAKELELGVNVPNIQTNLFVDEDTRLSRYSICQSCEFLSVLKTCSQCGCIMPLKVRFTDSSCPIDKW